MIQAIFRSLSAIFLAAFLLATSQAAPVVESERTHVDLRRTTLVVRDIDTSLKFYRDALGMKLSYDNEINSPRGAGTAEAETARRLVFLRANDDYIGVLGLLQYIKPAKPRLDLSDTAFNEGTTVMVFNTQNLQSSLAKAKQIEGVVMLSEPKLVSYPSYDGKSTISVLVSVLQDPDGFTVELNQLQEALH